MSAMEELIERLKSLSGPDGESDARIWFIADKQSASCCFWNATLGLPKPIPENLPGGLGRSAVISNAPRYTESIDAALTLVPEGMSWRVESDGEPITIQPGAAVFDPVTKGKLPGIPIYNGSTAAIALCIAALKARAQED